MTTIKESLEAAVQSAFVNVISTTLELVRNEQVTKDTTTEELTEMLKKANISPVTQMPKTSSSFKSASSVTDKKNKKPVWFTESVFMRDYYGKEMRCCYKPIRGQNQGKVCGAHVTDLDESLLESDPDRILCTTDRSKGSKGKAKTDAKVPPKTASAARSVSASKKDLREASGVDLETAFVSAPKKWAGLKSGDKLYKNQFVIREGKAIGKTERPVKKDFVFDEDYEDNLEEIESDDDLGDYAPKKAKKQVKKSSKKSDDEEDDDDDELKDVLESDKDDDEDDE